MCRKVHVYQVKSSSEWYTECIKSAAAFTYTAFHSANSRVNFVLLVYWRVLTANDFNESKAAIKDNKLVEVKPQSGSGLASRSVQPQQLGHCLLYSRKRSCIWSKWTASHLQLVKWPRKTNVNKYRSIWRPGHIESQLVYCVARSRQAVRNNSNIPQCFNEFVYNRHVWKSNLREQETRISPT